MANYTTGKMIFNGYSQMSNTAVQPVSWTTTAPGTTSVPSSVHTHQIPPYSASAFGSMSATYPYPLLPTVEFDLEFDGAICPIETAVADGRNVYVTIVIGGNQNSKVRIKVPTNPDKVREMCKALLNMADVMDSADTVDIMTNGNQP